MKIRNVQDVAAWRLCSGCGACAYICPEKKIKLLDFLNDGIRPVFETNGCESCYECLKVCPGYETKHLNFNGSTESIPKLSKNWGPILEIWEGYASDPEIRFNGSSGGLATALSLYCLEREGMHGVLHIGPDPNFPLKNKTVLSKDREELLSRTGSRYSPASPCDSLDKIEEAPRPCVFIAKPCDVAGLRKAQILRPDLDKKVGAAIGIFCAGTPSTQGTIDLLGRLGVNSEKVEKIRYRGKGWPGQATARVKGQKVSSYKTSYQESWGFLQKYRPYRCFLCPDGTSEFADISCGDPWYRDIGKNDPGYSLVLIRTERGREIIRGAIETGYVHLEQADHLILEKSQKNLLSKRKAVWGRLIGFRILGLPSPRFEGFSLFSSWLDLTLKEKLRSFLGTIKRIFQRKYYLPIKFSR